MLRWRKLLLGCGVFYIAHQPSQPMKHSLIALTTLALALSHSAG